MLVNFLPFLNPQSRDSSGLPGMAKCQASENLITCGRQNASAPQATMWVFSQAQNFEAQRDCHHTLGGEWNKTQTPLAGLLKQGVGRTQKEQSGLKSRIPVEALRCQAWFIQPIALFNGHPRALESQISP